MSHKEKKLAKKKPVKKPAKDVYTREYLRTRLKRIKRKK